jgi:hypothetical protein
MVDPVLKVADASGFRVGDTALVMQNRYPVPGTGSRRAKRPVVDSKGTEETEGPNVRSNISAKAESSRTGGFLTCCKTVSACGLTQQPAYFGLHNSRHSVVGASMGRK